MKITDLAAAAATGLGTGYSPLAPGTCGSLLAVLAAWLFSPLGWWTLPLAALLTALAGVPLSSWAEGRWGHDPTRVVIDEVAGQWLALVLVPRTLAPYFLAFALFRLFDIAKPWGIGRAQEAPGGWGVMLDDLLAGLYANILIQLGLLVFHRQGSALAGLLGLT